jgi:hypothetical protein
MYAEYLQVVKAPAGSTSTPASASSAAVTKKPEDSLPPYTCLKEEGEQLRIALVRLTLPTDMDIYGYFPLADNLSLVQCNYCNKIVKTSRFQQHFGTAYAPL